MSELRITSLEVTEIAMSLAVPYVQSFGTTSTSTVVVVQLRTQSGLVGLGEADPHPPITSETSASVVGVLKHVLAPAIIGRDASSRLALLAAMDAAVPANLMAKGAIDMALWDLAGKALGVPVHVLLGGAQRDTLPLLWPLGIRHDTKLLLDEADAKVRDGYDTFMVKLNGDNADLGRVKAVHKAHPDVKIVADANQALSVYEAHRRVNDLNGVRGVGLIFEQPVAVKDAWAFPELRRRSYHRLSADESLWSTRDIREMCESHAVDVLSLKVSKNGGITKTVEAAGIARVYGVDVLMNSMLELGISQAASLAVAATLPNLVPDFGHALASTARMQDDITDYSRLIEKGGVVRLPTEPGLGVTLNTTNMQRYATSHAIISERDL